MNIEIAESVSAATRAVQTGDFAAARLRYIEAGDCAVRFQLWRSAFRAYRSALELDLAEPTPVARLATLRASWTMLADWTDYARVLGAKPQWPALRAIGARILSADSGTVVECPGVGPVIELAMSDADLIEVSPDGRFPHMPRAMAMLVVRRALWPWPREHDGMRVRVAYRAMPVVSLDETGCWHALSSRPAV